VRLFSFVLALALPLSAHAQQQDAAFVFADRPQARAVLEARDEYVRATGELERSAKMRSADPVDEERFATRMGQQALAWDGPERRRLEPVLARLDRFVSGMKWRRPARILMVKASDNLMGGLPHTRANAIVLPQSELSRESEYLSYIVAHELFHVLSRADPELREELYAAIGFRACARVDMSEALRRLRITNPDAVESGHVVQVRVGGRRVEALPFVHLPRGQFDPRAGFTAHLTVSWLPVERSGKGCSIASDPQSLRPDELEGLYEQIGRNTEYIMHPEEILADNFALLFLLSGRDTPREVPSPEILERIRAIMLSASAAPRTSQPLSRAVPASP
jgi:hypothetical protein